MRCGAALLLALSLAALLVAAAAAAGALPAGAREALLDSEARRAKDCPHCPPCPPPPANCSYYDSNGLNEYYYIVDGTNIC